MHPVLTLSFVMVSLCGVPASERALDVEIANVAAFARLYGVVRYFYPSDSAATLDWARFAVHGTAMARAARDASALARSLTELTAPLGPGIVVAPTLRPAAPPGAAGGTLVAWRYFGAGLDASQNVYSSRRTGRSATRRPQIDGFVTVMQNVPAAGLAGRGIRLRARARVLSGDRSGSGALWLRVDRPNEQMGFFDNMGDRPIRESEWREYTIEGQVAEDAAGVAFGVMASGAAKADFDSVELETRGDDGKWSAVPLSDGGFEAEKEASPESRWFRAGTSRTAVVVRLAQAAPEGKQFLRLKPSDVPATPEPSPLDRLAVEAGDHADVDLGAGLQARVPLALTDEEARTSPERQGALDALRAAVARAPLAGDPPPLDVRLADVVVAWNVYRHFYPYWQEAGVDWDGRLPALLQSAAAALNRAAHADALKALVHDVRDGHGGVTDTSARVARAGLPAGLAVVEDRVVVIATAVPELPVGAEVLEIDGAPAATLLAGLLAHSSGTEQWRRVRAGWELGLGTPGSDARLRIDDGQGVREISVRRIETTPPVEKRPEPVTEIEPGIWYVDLTRAKMALVQPSLGKLATARAVVFDMRGYPTDSGARLLPHLLEAAETDLWMHVWKLTGPFGRTAGWEDFGWNVKPAQPHLGGRRVFLTDGRAISYGESVMGYVGDRKLGTIVGGPTAGTNGNVATFDLPGGFRISFTAMHVTGHDGKSPFHLVGVRPQIAVAPTIPGLRAGRDEVLEKGLELARTP
jgi:hypothetical protein